MSSQSSNLQTAHLGLKIMLCSPIRALLYNQILNRHCIIDSKYEKLELCALTHLACRYRCHQPMSSRV